MEQTTVLLEDVDRLDNAELMARLRRLVATDRALTARLLVHLGEVDARGLFRDQAWPSMFTYAVQELHMSEAEAYLRIHAARLGRQFPLVVQLLAQGELHLSAIKLLGAHLTQDNHALLLERARCKSKREVELLVAELAPKPDVASRMRKLPEPSSVRVAKTQPPAMAVTPPSTDSHRERVAPPPSEVRRERQPLQLEPPPARASSAPLSPGRYKVEFTADQALHDDLEQLKNLLRHQVPDGDLATLVARAVRSLVEATRTKRFARARPKKLPHTNKPPARRRKLRSRYIPRAVVREVHERDGEQCTFVSSDGRRCPERGFLELHHHETPFARGGPATVTNLRLVCRAHNALLAERDFGTDFMQTKRLNTRQPRGEPSPQLAPERAQT